MTKRTDRPEDPCCEGCFGMTYIPELDRRFILCNNPWSDHYGHVLDSLHSCQEFGVECPVGEEGLNPGMIEIREDRLREASKLSLELSKVWENATPRLRNALLRAFYRYKGRKPLELLTDTELYAITGIGKKLLAEIRKVIPQPEGCSGWENATPRLRNAILRASDRYKGRKPLELLTDTELYAITGIGKKLLAEIRKVIPQPEGGSV